jgi:hypothetical protein
MFLPGLRAVQNAQEVDLDIVASCDGHLALIECKDMQAGMSRKAALEVQEQLRPVIDIALKVKAKLVFISTLATPSEVPSGLLRFVSSENKRWQGQLSIHLLTRNHLEGGPDASQWSGTLLPKPIRKAPGIVTIGASLAFQQDNRHPITFAHP